MKRSFILFAFILLTMAACNSFEQSFVANESKGEKTGIDSFRIPHSTAPLSQEEAVKVARQFTVLNGVQTKAGGTKAVSSVYAIESHQGNPAMYAVNYGKDDGFVIVNTSRKYFPVLAFSETGHYAQDRNSSGLDVWINEQKTMIEAAEALPLDSLTVVSRSWLNYEKNTADKVQTKSGNTYMPFRDSAIAEWELEGYECMDLQTSGMYLNPIIYNEWCELAEEQSNPNYDYMESAVVLYYATQSTSQVGPFLSTTWGHYAPYNQLSSPYNGYPAGSSIAAMAQIMRYYQWPTIYPWSTMSDTTATYYTQLLYYNLNRDAQTNSQGETDINNLKNAITGNQYHYNYSASVVNHSLSTAKSNINSGKPVFMEGLTAQQAQQAKHAWVCDGQQTYTMAIHLILMVYTLDDEYSQVTGGGGYYSDSNTYEYFHMNWCENGSGNGWFSGDNSSFSGYMNNVWTQNNYSSNRKDIVNITPNN